MTINGFRDTLFLEKPISPFVKYKNCPVIWLIHETSTPPQHQRTKVFDAQQIPGVAASVSWWPDDGTFLAMHWGFVQQQGWIGILQRFFCNVQDFDIFIAFVDSIGCTYASMAFGIALDSMIQCHLRGHVFIHRKNTPKRIDVKC